jgi:hypothetical protein
VAHFTLQVERGGPILAAVVAVSEARAAALRAAGQAIPNAVPIRALVDTGASCSCIDPSVLAALALTATGSVSLRTPSTGSQPHDFDQYDVGLAIPGPPDAQPLYRGTVPVVAANLTVQGIQALIGRDVLSSCVLVYNGSTNLFTLAF